MLLDMEIIKDLKTKFVIAYVDSPNINSRLK